MKRRGFLQLTSLSAAALTLSKSGLSARALPGTGQPAAAGDPIFEMFVNPENKHRPFVRWWWNGDRVQKQEVLRELDLMKEAGIGGVEINPIKWNEHADGIGIQQLTWGSDEWLDVVEAAVKGAKERDIVCDMIIGSGWPFGGEFVPRNEQSQIIILGTRNLEGNRQHTITKKELLDSVTPPSNYAGSLKELFLLRLAPAVMNSFVPGVELNGELDKDSIAIDTPAGDHVLYYLVKITGFQAVIQGALGANGPVINHYDKAAVENYLNRFSTMLTAKLGPLNNYFRAFFTDSIELEGANWCSDLFEQFRKRRGYDLEPYFPYILFKVGHMGNRVTESYGAKFSPELQETLNRIHYDFEQTRLDLFEEHFIRTFTAWCTRIGVKSRMQAYGMDCNPIEASMLIDIPECETWIWTPEVDEFGRTLKGLKGRNYTMVNKFVSSAAHLAGRQLISCEEMTNTGQIFSTTLERVKVTGDQSNLSGVTHSILHGFNYSPMEAPFPGWLRYGSFFNERNTWWPYFRLWSDYKARLSSLFQNSVMQADIAVLHPLADLASKYGYQRDPFPAVAYPSYVHQVWEAIHQCGNSCDYVSEHIIQQAAKSRDGLTYNTRRYKALLLIEVETLEPATAKAIRQFAEKGGKVIFIAKSPHLSSGFTGFPKKSQSIVADMQAVLKHSGTTGVVAAPTEDVLSWYRPIQQQFSLAPYVRISDPVYHVSQLYYKAEGKDIFFFTNYSARESHAFTAGFDSKKKAWLWDAETGKRSLYPADAKGQLKISLGPSESRIIVFEEGEGGETYLPLVLDESGGRELQGPWELTLQHVNDTTKKIRLDSLTDLKLRGDTKDFSGILLYHKVVKMDKPGGKLYLSLGHINDVSELEVNGMPLGTRWYGNHVYDITAAVKEGDNYITLKIVTTLGAYTQSLKNNPAAQEWSRGPLFGPTGLVNPVKILSLPAR